MTYVQSQEKSQEKSQKTVQVEVIYALVQRQERVSLKLPAVSGN